MAMIQWPDLSPILGSMCWAVIGGVATRAYMPERATRDLDILIAQADAAEVYERLQAAGFARLQVLAVGGVSWRTPDGGFLDVVASAEPWVPEALQRPETDPQGLPVLALPYLVLTKVQAGRVQDLADAARMLGLASPAARQATRQVIERWQPDALEDVESLISLGELEMGD